MNVEEIKKAVDAARQRQVRNGEWYDGSHWQQADTALIALWDEHRSLKWTIAEEIAAMPAVVGKRVQIQAVIAEADQRGGLLEVEIDFGRWIVIGNTKVALMQEQEASDAAEI